MDLLVNVYIDIQGQRDDAKAGVIPLLRYFLGEEGTYGFEKRYEGNPQRPAAACVCIIWQGPVPDAGVCCFTNGRAVGCG